MNVLKLALFAGAAAVAFALWWWCKGRPQHPAPPQDEYGADRP